MSSNNLKKDENESLLLIDTSNKSYNSITNDESEKKNDSIVYCIHGLDSELCCQVTCIKDNARQNYELPHCHFYNEENNRIDEQARFRLILASILCLIFMAIEIAGGLWANSLAIASDAAHLLTDFASFMISLFSIWMASKPASKNMSFGWHRAEVIGALTSILMIWVVTGILCYIATERIVENDFEIQSEIMVITAAIGVVVNIVMGCSLTCGGIPHGHSHGGGMENGHGHDHSHGFSTSDHQGKGNINVRAAFIHVLGDFFQSLGVLIASLVIYFYPDYRIIDPICTFFFSIIVLITTLTIMRDVLNVLMEGIPKGIDIKEVQRTLLNIDGVRKVHNLRIWSLSLDKAALSTHLAIEKGKESTHILNATIREIKSRYDIYELTVQIEEYRDEMKDCQQCQTFN
ncbi:proton-coupled zinc antiporter SLC30A2-like [Dermatophagoides pteronyssinus]|uniref:proton-coupled zinc antiporter SLC30A2-like n=1 Tax=Dermatophagoides pteronyssinus TaxID=6956 RepID=UPI003F66A806